MPGGKTQQLLGRGFDQHAAGLVYAADNPFAIGLFKRQRRMIEQVAIPQLTFAQLPLALAQQVRGIPDGAGHGRDFIGAARQRFQGGSLGQLSRVTLQRPDAPGEPAGDQQMHDERA